MKTVIIPSDYHPFVIEVNGVKYTYPEGTEQSVPDEVASAIENIYKLAPREGDPNPVPFGVDADGKEEYKSKYTGAEIDAAVAKAGTVPAVTEADAGKALVVDEEGKIVAGEASGDSNFKIVFEDDSTCIIGYDNNKQEPIIGGSTPVGIESFPYKLLLTIDDIFVYFCIKLTDVDIANLREHISQIGYTITFSVDSDLNYIDYETYKVYPIIQYDDETIIGDYQLLYENGKLSAFMSLPFDPAVTIKIEIDIDSTKQIKLIITR